ncbi:uncharacterized protein N7496_005856 [Penicillium cataractarum]|uniref:Uncharacterized protein n=1 Tax=Penicillium cataractarum TaxID=2100454 RepID=A0A9W9S2C9_9EURO|nr:uncharacterized protein N7496_005856 [Penicillium cataractarum]KAJ5369764.1 hypothetical protein N7496_005856 [Penicillium cataractarum]
MSQVFTSPAKVLSWDEDRSPNTQSTLPRLTPATVKMNLSELNTEITSTYQMMYLPAGGGREKDGSAVFIFSDVLESQDFQGKAGSFMTQGKGTFDAMKFRVQGSFEIVPGSGKGELGEMFKNGGSGSFESDEKDPGQVNYKFELPA